MISRIAYMISLFLSSRGVIGEDERDVYQYGYEVLLDTILDTILLLIFGAVIHRFTETICFILVFTAVRAFSGGYHANTRVKCVCFTFSCCVIAVVFGVFPICSSPLYILAGLVFSWVVLLWLSPIENVNKPLTSEEKRRNRKKSLFLLLLVSSIVLFFRYLGYAEAGVLMNTMLLISFLMVAVHIKGGEDSEGENVESC